MRPLIDAHCHLDGYDDGEIGDIVNRAEEAGVRIIVNAGTTLRSSQRCAALAKRFPNLYAGVGIHPMELTGPLDGAARAQLISCAASNEKVIVMSEIGLDFMDNMPDRAAQYQAFRAQIGMARELGLPIVFHSREAHAETLRALREERGYEVGGAMHYFQGDADTARRAIDLGFHISLAKPLLRLPDLQRVAAELPLDSVVLETDSAPQPFKANRERWTEPRDLALVASKFAELKDIDVNDARRATSANFLRMLGRNGEALRAKVFPPSVQDGEPATGPK